MEPLQSIDPTLETIKTIPQTQTEVHQPKQDIEALRELIQITGSVPLSIAIVLAMLFYRTQKTSAQSLQDIQYKQAKLEHEISNVKQELLEIKDEIDSHEKVKLELQDTKVKIARIEQALELLETKN
jgi:C4-dicarboxylate-specific signal transduction histidine kinase